MLVCYLACKGVCCDQWGAHLQLAVLLGPMLSCCVPASSMSCCTLPVFLVLLPPCSQDSKHPAMTRYCHDLSCVIVVLWSCSTYVLNKPALQFILSNSHTLCKPVADFTVYNLWVAHDEVLHNASHMCGLTAHAQHCSCRTSITSCWWATSISRHLVGGLRCSEGCVDSS